MMVECDICDGTGDGAGQGNDFPECEWCCGTGEYELDDDEDE